MRSFKNNGVKAASVAASAPVVAKKMPTATFGKGGAAGGAGGGPTALLIICYNRPRYLKRTLHMLTEQYAKSIKVAGSVSQWQIIISQVIAVRLG